MTKKLPAWAGHLIKPILFLLLTGVILLGLSYTLRPYSGSASRKNLCGFYAEPEQTLDMVVVGASSTFAFWEPMEFWNAYGTASYNFSASDLPPQTMKYCLKEIAKTQSPKLFVLDMKTFAVAEDGYYKAPDVANMDYEVPLRSIIDNMKYSPLRSEMIENCLPETESRISYYFDLIKYHTEWPRLADKQSLAFMTNEAHDYLKGFKLTEAYKALEAKDYSNMKKKLPLSDRLQVILKDLLDYCQEEELNVIFTIGPYREKKEHKQRFNFMAEVIESYGYTFVDFNDYRDEIGVDYAMDYYDKDHVNVFGAEKYTAYLGAYLQEHFDLPDHRGEAAYASWDEDYKKWQSAVEKTKTEVVKLREKAENEDKS